MTDTETKPTAKLTLKNARAALQEILAKTNVDYAEISGDEAVDALVEIAGIVNEALNPKTGPSALVVTTDKVADFIMDNFHLAFAQNDEIGEALNAAGITSPSGKPWTRSNISKIMPGVREKITEKVRMTHRPATPAEQPQTQEPAETVTEVQEPVVEAQEATAPVSEPEAAAEEKATPEPAQAPEEAPAEDDDAADQLLAELEGLDDLDTSSS